MSETARVQRWREAKRQQGLKPCTVWLTPEEELRLKDLAVQQHCAPSAIIQQALAQFSPSRLPSISNDTDTALLRDMMRAEISAMQAASTPVAATVTDTAQLRALIQDEIAILQTASVLATATATVTDAEQLRTLIQDELAASALVTATATAMVTATLPALVRAIVEDLALEALGMPATATSNRYETDTGDHKQTAASPRDSIADTNSNETDTVHPAVAPTRRAAKRPAPPVAAQDQNGTPAQPHAPRKGGRPTTVRPRILELLQAHPEGLTAVEIKVHLSLDKNIGDTLAGMVRNQLLTKQGHGAQVRYRLDKARRSRGTSSTRQGAK